MEENKERNIVWKPQPRQLEFMRRPEPEALYGGAAGGSLFPAFSASNSRVVKYVSFSSLDGGTGIFLSTGSSIVGR